MSEKLRVLFLCTGNSCRSQMAEGLCRHLRAEQIQSFSAGIETHGLNPFAVRVMSDLAPLIQEEIWEVLQALKAQGHAILVIDKDIEAMMTFADRHYFVQNGRVGWVGTTEELSAHPEVIEKYLGI